MSILWLSAEPTLERPSGDRVEEMNFRYIDEKLVDPGDLKRLFGHDSRDVLCGCSRSHPGRRRPSPHKRWKRFQGQALPRSITLEWRIALVGRQPNICTKRLKDKGEKELDIQFNSNIFVEALPL